MEKEKKIEELKEKKLMLEIKDLQKKWYHNPAFLSILIPALIAILSIATIYFTGVLDAKKEWLSVEKSNLELDIRQFQKEKETLKNELRVLNTDKKRLQDSIKHLVLSMENELKILNTTKKHLQDSVQLLVTSLERTPSAAKIFNLMESFEEIVTRVQLTEADKHWQKNIDEVIERKNKMFKEYWGGNYDTMWD